MAQDAQLISQASKVESLASDGLVSVSTGAGQPQKNMELAKFADSLGSSVPLQQTSEQVNITGLYARTSDGKMVELTKESVASVIGNLLGNPLKREYVVTKDNIDGALTPGFYTMVFEPISIGGGTSNFYGVMNVYESDTYIVQVGYATTGVILRNYKKNSKVWSPWQRIDNFGYNTLAELSSGVAGQIGVNTHSILPYRGDLTTDMESDPRLQSGIYRQKENPMTSVDNTALYHGVLICINSIESEYGAYGIQFYFFGDGAKILARGIEYGALKNWTAI